MVDEKAQDRPPASLQAGPFASTVPGIVDGNILCVGGAVADTTFVAQQAVVPGTSNPATRSWAFGGVARNIAENLRRLGVRTALASRVGDDENGRRLKRHLDTLGVDNRFVDVVAGAQTAEFIALLEPDRNLNVAVADMAIFDRLDRTLLDRFAGCITPDWILADCNCGAELLGMLIGRARSLPGRIAVDAVSVAKAERLPATLSGIDLLFLNVAEAASLLRIPRKDLVPEDAIRRLRQRGASAVVLTLGPEGLLVGAASGEIAPVAAVPADAVADVNGAGDAMIATTLAATLAGLALPLAARWGCIAATLTLEKIGSTRPDLSFALLKERAERLPSPVVEPKA